VAAIASERNLMSGTESGRLHLARVRQASHKAPARVRSDPFGLPMEYPFCHTLCFSPVDF